MAAPNIFAPTTITGKSFPLVITTSSTDIVANAAASGTVVRVTTLMIANIHASAAATVEIDLFRAAVANRGPGKAVNIPVGSRYDAITDDTRIYLEEGDALRVKASANSALEGLVSYEILA